MFQTYKKGPNLLWNWDVKFCPAVAEPVSVFQIVICLGHTVNRRPGPETEINASTDPIQSIESPVSTVNDVAIVAVHKFASECRSS